MCGIAGTWATSLSGEDISAQITRMTSSLVHRGPDQQGVWTDSENHVGLGHRRLSILDLTESGRQPMTSRSGRYVIVFNGEIYNFLELKKRLEGLRYEFRGHSDTEVLLAAIDVWGVIVAVEQLLGMFAFALWDRNERTLTLVRDRIGEKPLYYGWHGGSFWFASELKAIALATNSLTVDRDALTSYVRSGYVPAPWSIYQHIYKLPPGCLIELSNTSRPGGFSPQADSSPSAPQSYWTVAAAAARGRGDMIEDAGEATTLLDGLLRRSIGLQTVADVPVGAFLSGGIDSSLVVGVMQALASRPVNTFTVGYAEQAFDESTFAADIARHLGTNHQTLTISSADTLGVIPDLATIYDEPFADASQIPTYLISKLARQKVTVALSGDGGDELFAGYNRYFATDQLWNGIGIVPHWLRAPTGKLLSSIPPQSWDSAYDSLVGRWQADKRRQRNIGLKAHKLGRMLQRSSVTDVYQDLLSFWHRPEDIVIGGTEPAGVIEGALPEGVSAFMDRAMFWDQTGYLPGDNLAKVDRASMSVSLETRLPLLSHEIIEFSWRVPLPLKYHDGQSKWLLRQVLYQYVPRQLIERPKMGFSVPISEWLRGPLKQWGEDLLSGELLRRQGYFNVNAVELAWHQHQSGRVDHGNGLWTLLMFQSWLANSGLDHRE